MREIKKNHPETGKLTIYRSNKVYVFPMKIALNGCDYEFLGAGSFNVAYKSVDEPYEVYKEPYSEPGKTDLPERAVRLWSEINPTLQARLAGNGRGWFAPYVSGAKPTDTEISNAILDIYIRTGRIVIDGFVKGNFKQMLDGTLICVDIGLALQLEVRLEKIQSEVSLQCWYQKMQKIYDDEFRQLPLSNSLVVKMIQALLYLKQHRPDETNFDCLNNNPDFVVTLADAYQKKLNPMRITGFAEQFLTVENLIAKHPLLSQVHPLGFDCQTMLEMSLNPLFGAEHIAVLGWLVNEKKCRQEIAYGTLKLLTEDQVVLVRKYYDVNSSLVRVFSRMNQAGFVFLETHKEFFSFFADEGGCIADIIALIKTRKPEKLAAWIIDYRESDDKQLFWEVILAGNEPKGAVDKLAEFVEGLIAKSKLFEPFKTRKMAWEALNRADYLGVCSEMRYQLELKQTLTDAERWTLFIINRLLLNQLAGLEIARMDARNAYAVVVKRAVEHVLFDSPQRDEDRIALKALIQQLAVKRDAPEWVREFAERFMPREEKSPASMFAVAPVLLLADPAASSALVTVEGVRKLSDSLEEWDRVEHGEVNQEVLLGRANTLCKEGFVYCIAESEKKNLRVAKVNELIAVEKYVSAERQKSLPDNLLILLQLDALKAKLLYYETFYELRVNNKQRHLFFQEANLQTFVTELRAVGAMLLQVGNLLASKSFSEVKNPAANQFIIRGLPQNALTKLNMELKNIAGALHKLSYGKVACIGGL